jgi:hypothetical protein
MTPRPAGRDQVGAHPRAGLVGAPDVVADGSAVRQQFRSGEQHRTAPAPPVTAAATGLPFARLLAAEVSSAALVIPTMVATVGADTAR